MNKIKSTFLTASIVAGLSVSSSYASPWASPGDSTLRADVELLAHHGLISGPVNSWPMSWKQITSGFYKADAITLPAHVQRALDRVRDKVPGEINGSARIAATNNPNIIRGFGYTPRNDLSISSSLEINAETGTTVHVEGGYRKGNGEDYAHLDGSYISQDIGNWAVYAGAIDRWWGPGQESTLILSNNARPIPSIGLRRIEAKPFKTKWLSWMGPWSWDMFISQMEEERFFPKPYLVGMRLGFEPINNFEVTFSRSLQLCGEGRPCGFKQWTRGLIAIGDLDNKGPYQEQPGNQLANMEFSYSLNLNNNTNLKLYIDATGEDLQYFIPFKYAKIIGASLHKGNHDGSSWKLNGEFSDTLSQHGWIIGTRQNRVIYYGMYPNGYRYYGRALGHSLDGDSELITLSTTYHSNKSWNANLKLHQGKIEKIGDTKYSTSQNLITRKFYQVDSSLTVQTNYGEIEAQLRFINNNPFTLGDDDSDFSSYISWVIKL